MPAAAPAPSAGHWCACASLAWPTGRMRLVRVGWRATQTSNAYILDPAAPPPSCAGQNGRETRFIRFNRPTKRWSVIEGDVAARRNAAQQILALGFAVPSHLAAAPNG